MEKPLLALVFRFRYDTVEVDLAQPFQALLGPLPFFLHPLHLVSQVDSSQHSVHPGVWEDCRRDDPTHLIIGNVTGDGPAVGGAVHVRPGVGPPSTESSGVKARSCL